MIPIVKICGLKTLEAIEAAKGADYIGFVFFSRSPRNISTQAAAELKPHISVRTVAVTVDASDELLSDIMNMLRPDYIQLHGNESPARAADLKKKMSVGIIKAISVRTAADMDAAAAFEDTVDMLMFDAKSSGDVPGGNGIPFDWKILQGRKFKVPYFLSGGLNIGNVETALQQSGASLLDISSGLESSPGKKEPQMIVEFVKKVKSLSV